MPAVLPKLAVIFDMDGVLVDSYRTHFLSWRAACRDFQLPDMTEAEFAATFGRTSREVIEATWPNQNFSPAQVHELDEHKEALYRQLLAREFPIMPGAVELIESLVAAGFLLAVGSSAPPPNVWESLAGLGCRHRFGAVVTGADVVRGKPDPQVFLLGAERLGVAPVHCCVVEDAPAGVAAALAAHMHCVGFASQGRTSAQLRTAHKVVRSLHELSPALFTSLILATAG